MEILESPNFVMNPVFSENSETIWDLKINCSICSNLTFNSKCINCLVNIVKSCGIVGKRIGNITFENKWQLNATGSKIIFDLWQKRENLRKICNLKPDSEKRGDFLSDFITSFAHRFQNSELPENYFTTKKNALEKDTISFLKYSINRNFNSSNSIEELFNPFLTKKVKFIEENVDYGTTIVSYNLLDANLFQVKICETKGPELYYSFTPLYDIDGYFHFKQIIQVISSNLEEIFDPNQTIEEEIEALKRKSTFILHKTFPGLKKEEIEILAIFSALHFLNFTKIYGLLADENIEEFFLDSPQDVIYLDHKIHGRCRTNIKLNETELESFKSLSKILSKKRLETNFPSLKYALNLFGSQFRIAIDIGPINLNEISIAIRRPRKMGWNLCELIQNNTISSELAAFLLWCAENKINITVTGETDTGKTTLINAIDKLLPLNLRRIYIEDVKESLPRNYEAHQMFFQASDSQDAKSKSNLIISLLHRSPDFVYLGEILTQEEAQAMFHALSLGLKGVQTIHAQSVESLVNRWIFHFKISPSSLQNLGVIVLMKILGKKRFVTEISEILYHEEKIEPIKIVLFNPVTNSWTYSKKLFNSTKVQESLKFQSFDEIEFNRALKNLEGKIKNV